MILPKYKINSEKYRPVLTIPDSFSEYRGKLTRRQYIKLLKDFFWEISYIIIRKNYYFKLPGMGKILIKKYKCPSKNLNYDYKLYNETGLKKKLLNLHTDGFYFRFKWEYTCKQDNNLRYYKFKSIRGEDKQIGARGLAAWIKKCSVDPTLKDYDARQ